MRPRSAGTFLISRSATSANARRLGEDPLDRVAVEILDREQVIALRYAAQPRTRARRRDRDLVDAVELGDAHVHVLGARGRQVLADVVGADRQLAVAAVGEHRELHARGPPVVEERLDRGADRAAGVEHVVDDHDRALPSRRSRRASACTTGASGRVATSSR